MRIETALRYENHDDHEAWFSNTPDLEAENVAFYIPSGVWVAMGRPQTLTVTFAPAPKEES